MNEKQMNKKTKALMKSELNKNRQIQKYGEVSKTMIGTHENHDDVKELDLIDAHVDVQAVSKMIRDYTSLETLNLAGNYIGNKGARDIAEMIQENMTIKSLILTNCSIGAQGLLDICTTLCHDGNENLEFLDIEGNYIPDKQLKMLLVLMYKNRNIQDIKYSLID
jgi:hypothetical protein